MTDITPENVARMMPHYVAAQGSTIAQMRLVLQSSEAGQALLRAGDVRLVWVNEGDLYACAAPAARLADLIPKADAELAVALAYQRAGDEMHPMLRSMISRSEAYNAILALAPADALAEVQALKAELNTAQTALALADFVYGHRAEAALQETKT